MAAREPIATFYRYEVWVTADLTEDQKREVATVLSGLAEEGEGRFHAAVVARKLGEHPIEDFAPGTIKHLLDSV